MERLKMGVVQPKQTPSGLSFYSPGWIYFQKSGHACDLDKYRPEMEKLKIGGTRILLAKSLQRNGAKHHLRAANKGMTSGYVVLLQCLG